MISAERVTGHRWDDGLLGRDEPDPVGEERPDGGSAIVLLCDHAGARVPRRLGALGVDAATLERHVALDIGALGVARGLSRALDAALLYQRYSRLVIDCNRPPHAPGAFVVDADGTRVPGNETLTPRDAAARVAELFHPYHAAIERCLSARLARGRPTAIVSVHSFTPSLVSRPAARPWHVGVLFRRDESLARALIRRLEDEGDLVVGTNEPYAIDDIGDYAVPVHAERRGLPHVELELRQDLIGDAAGQAAWAGRLARLLPLALADATGPDAAADVGPDHGPRA